MRRCMEWAGVSQDIAACPAVRAALVSLIITDSRQKRPIIEANETYYRGKKDLVSLVITDSPGRGVGRESQ